MTAQDCLFGQMSMPLVLNVKEHYSVCQYAAITKWIPLYHEVAPFDNSFHIIIRNRVAKDK